jgi:transposase
LERAWGQDQQSWAKEMQQWLKTINQAVDDAGGAVTKKKADIYRHNLKQADIECPPPDAPPGKAKRGCIKRSKARNLLND